MHACTYTYTYTHSLSHIHSFTHSHTYSPAIPPNSPPPSSPSWKCWLCQDRYSLDSIDVFLTVDLVVHTSTYIMSFLSRTGEWLFLPWCHLLGWLGVKYQSLAYFAYSFVSNTCKVLCRCFCNVFSGERSGCVCHVCNRMNRICSSSHFLSVRNFNLCMFTSRTLCDFETISDKVKNDQKYNWGHCKFSWLLLLLLLSFFGHWLVSCLPCDPTITLCKNINIGFFFGTVYVKS